MSDRHDTTRDDEADDRPARETPDESAPAADDAVFGELDALDADLTFELPPRPALDRPASVPLIGRRETPAPDLFDRPAPVVTEAGTFGTLPDDRPLPDLGGDSWLRGIAARFVMLALTVVALTWLLALSAHQATGRVAAIPAIERGVAALTEIDALLVTHQEAIAAAGESRASEPGARVAVPGFPVPDASLTAEEARDLAPADQRALVLARAADAVYARGVDAFLVEGGTPVGTTALSTEGLARRLLATLTVSTHDRIGGWLSLLGMVAVALAVVLVLLGHGFARFGALAVPLLVAAAGGVASALGLRLVAALAGGDGGFADELTAIAQALAWTPVRNALWFAVAAVAVALPAAIGGLLFGERDDDVRYDRGADDVYDVERDPDVVEAR